MLTDDKTAIVTPEEFQALPEYSLTDPTGTTIGKKWKARDSRPAKPGETPFMRGWVFTDTWTMGEYTKHADPSKVGMKWRELLVVGR